MLPYVECAIERRRRFYLGVKHTIEVDPAMGPREAVLEQSRKASVMWKALSEEEKEVGLLHFSIGIPPLRAFPLPAFHFSLQEGV